MTKEKQFSFLSKDGKTKIHAVKWMPESGEYRAVLQITHGMVEYIERYKPFAEFLNDQGILVVGHDHLGHGASVASEEELGYFAEPDPSDTLVEDMHTLRTTIQTENPGVPYFMMGHSMGSFLLRQYLTMRAEGLAGAIVMGTGDMPYALLKAGQAVCKSISLTKGWHHRSHLVNQLGMGGYNRQFEPSDSTKDWITSDDSKRKEYEADPLCNFVFTVNGYYQMFEGMKVLTRKRAMDKISTDLPVIFVSGAEDPVGSNGVGVTRVFQKYEAHGMTDVEMKLYAGDRHEILNETDREEVYEDLYRWMEKRI